jgi:RimK family alpha-L-glutamate ligase
MRFALVARRSTPTNDALSAAIGDGMRWETMAPDLALDTLRFGDVALGRLDVLETLDGVDDGLWALGALAARGTTVLNEASALLATHDKLLTSRLLRRAGLPHPLTLHVRPGRAFPGLALRPPVVVKPRYGSWGYGVVRCDDAASLRETLAALVDFPWFRRHGALVQHLVPPLGFDLRVLVAGGRVVGSVFRDAAAGEWRTNISLGGTRRPVAEIPEDAQALALAASAATGAALVGVDLLPLRRGWTVLEVNGAVEFTGDYSLSGDVFAEAAGALFGAALGADADTEALAAV